MAGSVPRILLEGPPGIGKTTLVRRLVDLLRADGVPVAGFTTHELREHGRRVGFAVADLDGHDAVLAHAGRDRGPRVGRYRVDVAALERIALPALERARTLRGGVAVLDELGRMELASPAFVAAVYELFAGDVPLAATVHVMAHPVTDGLKHRPDVELVAVTHANRDQLPARLAELLVRDLGK